MALPFLPLLQGVGLAFQAIGQRDQIQAQENASRYRSQVAMQNAQLIMRSARLEKTRATKRKRQFLGTQRVAIAKSGVLMEGSPFDVVVDSAAELEMDLQIDFFNSQVAANTQIAAAQMSDLEANQFAKQKKFDPLKTIISGALNLNAGAFVSGLKDSDGGNDPNRIVARSSRPGGRTVRFSETGRK